MVGAAMIGVRIDAGGLLGENTKPGSLLQTSIMIAAPASGKLQRTPAQPFASNEGQWIRARTN